MNGDQRSDFSYDGRVFVPAPAATPSHLANPPAGHYHQDGDVIWAEFAGGGVVRGSLTGRRDREGVLHLAYCQLLDDGSVVSGRCTSYPTVLGDGRIRLDEHWERYGAGAGTGVSVIEEPLPTPAKE
jgi:hypothetical protein